RPSPSSSPGSTGRPSPGSRSPTSASARSAPSSRRWPSPGAPASCSCRSSSCRSRSRSSSAASGPAPRTILPVTWAFSRSTTSSLRSSRGPPLSTWFRNNRLALSAITAAFMIPAAIALVFFYAPVDQDGLNQKIFYFHVPIAITAYACFGWGAWKGLLHLWKRAPGADLESYVAIHQGVIFGLLTLITGSLWARISWGHWWLWGERQLVLFLV